MQYASKAKVEQYVASNHDVIRGRLTKLLDSAEEIYRDKGESTVLIKDRWVLIVNKNNLVTLFKVQAVTDEEDDFNDLYFAHMIGNIRARIREYETLTRETEDEIAERAENVERVEAQIKDHEQEIERLTRLRDSYQTIVDSLRDDVDSADMRVKHAVEDLVKAKVF